MRLIHGECLEEMQKLVEEGVKVDAVICVPPYGTTACKWDSVIPLQPMWDRLEKLVKPTSAICLFGAQPFTSILVSSNLNLFKYNWVWEKSRPGGFVMAKLKPLKNVEEILVFSKGNTANGSKKNMTYNPQGVEEGIEWERPQKYNKKDTGYSRESQKLKRKTDGSNYPRQIIKFSNPNRKVLHPTQKPIDLMEYLIKTYTNEGDTVLDFTMGSGTTGVACRNLNREFIGIELDDNYFNIAKQRIEE